MAGKKPSFITGANAKIKAGNVTLAYAQDVSYSTTVATIPVETMGRYEVVSNEPIAYFVEGSLSVVRYTNVAQANGMNGAAANGNGIGNWQLNGSSANNSGDKQLDPAKLLTSATWDLEVFQKYDNNGAVSTQLFEKILDCRFERRGGALNKRGIMVEQYTFKGILAHDDSFTAGNSGDQDLQ